MPSPVGHALAGLAAGWLVQGAPQLRTKTTWVREVALFGTLGILPDVDLLFGAHSGPTHGVGAAAFVGLAAFLVWPGRTAARIQSAIACAVAYGSHILLDWLGSDSSPPIGVMALWPLSREYFESTLHVFMAISRRYWQGAAFWRQNLIAVSRELVILGPILAAIVLTRPRKTHL